MCGTCRLRSTAQVFGEHACFLRQPAVPLSKLIFFKTVILPFSSEKGEEGEIYGKSNMETYITMCKIDSQWEFAVWVSFAGGLAVKNPAAMQETWVRSLGQKDTLENEMATHSSILAWKIPWTEEPGIKTSQKH